MWLLDVVALVVQLVALAGAEDVAWLYPEPGQIFNYNDTIVAQWESTYADPYFYVWASDDGNITIIRWLAAAVSTNGSYMYTFAAATSNTFPILSHFEIVDGASNLTTDGVNGVDGGEFTVTSTSAPPTTYGYLTTELPISSSISTTVSTTSSSTKTSTPTPLASSTTWSTSPLPAFTSTSTNPSSTSTWYSHPALDPGAKAGISIGLIAGVLLAIFAFYQIISMRRQLRQYKYAKPSATSESADRGAQLPSTRRRGHTRMATVSTLSYSDGPPKQEEPAELESQSPMLAELASPVWSSELEGRRFP